MGQGFLFGLGAADSSDATATAAKILSGYTAYVNDEKLTGTFSAVNVINAMTGNIITAQVSNSYTVAVTLTAGVDYILIAHRGGYFSGYYVNDYYIGKVVSGVLTQISAGAYCSCAKSGNTYTATLGNQYGAQSTAMMFAIPITVS